MYRFLPILLFAYSSAVTTDDIYDNSYALIIGINEYEHVEKLYYAVNDAESIQEMLLTLFDFPKENITILKNEEANKQSILKALSDITTKAELNDRVLVFFEGHGESYKLPNGGDMGYLIPVDCNLDNLYLSGISMQSVYDIVDKSAAKHILLLFDVAFFAFPSNREYEGVIDPSTTNYIKKIKEAKVRQIITAGGKDDLVLEKAEWGHSAFTSNLFRGLEENLADSNKDGFITGYELGLYIKNTTLDKTDNYQMSKSIKMSSDKGEFIFINNKYGKKDENLYSINRDDIYDDSWAVIIGIDKYKYSKQLNYAVKDAEAVKNMLINKFDYPEANIRYLVNEQATLSNIKLNLGEIATSAEENDRILVFYSGHGETLKGADGSETGYIIPYEGRQDNPYATGLVMDEILRTCQISKSKHMLFLMDACYSGLMTENVKGLSKPQEKGYLSKVANEKARQIITAGGKDEQVIERDEWQHSAFTKNLLAGLDDWESDTDNDGYVTADELGTYLRKSVTEDSDFQQTPQDGRFRNSGGGEFVFFGSNNNTGQYNLDFDNETVTSSITLKYWEYNPLGYHIAAPAIGLKITSRGKMTLFSSFIGASYSFNDRSAFDFGFQHSRNLSSHFDFTSNAIFIEYVEALALTDRIDPSGNYLYNTWGLYIENITYLDDKFKYNNEGIGVIPEVGLEWGWRWFEKRGNLNWDGAFRISLGYAINDITNVEGEKFYRGLIVGCGLALTY